jgi:hypothetical protein
MRFRFFALAFALAGILSADTIGVSVDGTCEAGSCPAMPLAFNSSDNLPVDFSFTLPDGDSYLIYGSFSGTNNGDGSGFSAGHDFEVMYLGNGTGGPSAADTLNIEQFDAYQTSVSSVVFDRDLIGQFSSDIAPSSSASSCVNGTLSCLGPATPPGSFDLPTTVPLTSSDDEFLWDPTFTSNFGAGSPVGSYIIWGTSAPPAPSPVPEPAYTSLLALGLGGGIAVRYMRRRTATKAASNRTESAVMSC